MIKFVSEEVYCLFYSLGESTACYPFLDGRPHTPKYECV